MFDENDNENIFKKVQQEPVLKNVYFLLPLSTCIYICYLLPDLIKLSPKMLVFITEYFKTNIAFSVPSPSIQLNLMT